MNKRFDFKMGDKVQVWDWNERLDNNAWSDYLLEVYHVESGHVYVKDSPTNTNDFTFDCVRFPPDPYATYDGGETQYRADLATLDAAAAGYNTLDGMLRNAPFFMRAWARMSAYLKGKGVL